MDIKISKRQHPVKIQSLSIGDWFSFEDDIYIITESKQKHVLVRSLEGSVGFSFDKMENVTPLKIKSIEFEEI